MSPTDRIQQLLLEKPGLKAQQIAAELGLDRRDVTTVLHTLDLTQDSAYRWWPRNRPASEPAAAPPRTLIGRLCRYYLECLARESGPFISLPATASAEFVPLDALPFDPGLPPSDRLIKKLIRKARQERGQLSLYIGYGLRLRPAPMRPDELRIEPALLYPIDDTPESPAEFLRPASTVPLFNLEILKSQPAADSGNLIDEAIQLSDELGLANPEEDLPPWDEIVLRLRRCRPDWDWREPLDPHALSHDPPLDQLSAFGIYNRAILFVGARSPFTYGLEVELRKLAQLDDAAIAPTALGDWLRGIPLDAPPADDRPVLELLPLNTEQREAVAQGLAAPLTVVTGPPGTGKSQVVIALLANMAWQGRSVLFSSKNNHAVDVVETRANDPGAHPLLLRLGKEEHHARVAQALTSSLADSARPDDRTAYAWLLRAHEESRARFANVQSQIAAVVALRNRVDELERAAEPARVLFGQDRFAALASFDVDAARQRLQSFADARDSHSLLPSRRARRPDLAPDAELLGIAAAEDPDQLHRDLAARLDDAAHARAYWDALAALRRARPLEDLARDLTRIAEDSAHSSLDLWRRWLRLWPSRWNPDDRKLLSEYVSLLQIIAGGDRFDEGAGRKVFRRYYQLFPQVTKLLPCWAVTSLSARGRLPFEPALFDLLVIDEASQCDIASALPLLYRAHRAVIIGDPLQLKHVSAVAPQQDRLLLVANGLAEGQAAWAYSVNSLFDAARSLCRHEDIVNLRDHHRSHRDIIGFSNRHFYRGGLRVATDHDALSPSGSTGPAVRWIDIRGKVVRPPRGGAMNVPEALALIADVRRLVVDRNYTGAIGVVTPFRAQANRIRTLAQQDPDLAARLAAVQFVVDTVHGFQGDERDVMFFSPVVSLGVNEGTLRFLKTHGNLFNVAITRARSELIVVGDRQAALDSGVDYLAAFAEYAHSLGSREPAAVAAQPGPEYPPVAHPELVSDWERVFYKALYAAGLRPLPQYDEPPYTLDFALFDDAGARKLDVEVDGENYHRTWDGELCRRDQIRSRRLDDLGWDIMRFWVYELREDLPACVARVQSWKAQSWRNARP